MSQPDLVTSHLGDEDVIATVSLSGDDELVVTPSRILHYEGEGILSDESVTEYPHDIGQLDVSSGRRKARLTLSYPLKGTKELTVPKASLDSVLHYLLAGILNVNNITGPGEAVRAVYRFNELTVVITSKRVVTSVGSAVWDGEYDEYRYEELTDLSFEEGRVATQIVLYINGRSQRIKAPKSQAAEVKHDLKEAIFGYFGVDSLQALSEAVSTDTEEVTESSNGFAFDEAVKPLSTSEEAEDVETDTESVWPYDSVDSHSNEPDTTLPPETLEDLEATLADMQMTIETQREALDAQAAAIEELIDTLSPDQ